MSIRLAFLALAFLATPLATATAQTDTAAARLRLRVDSVFSRYSGTDRPGCAVGVSRYGTVLLQRGYGMADLESGRPITPETIFESGSVAKQFVAATMLLLEQAGRLSLDDRLRRHLPELPPWADSITLRQMLGHTSGLRDQWTLFEIQGRPLGIVAHRLSEVLDLATRQQRLNFTPGTQYLYSNMGYILAGLVIQRVSGDSLAVASRRLLFEPLGLTHTGWRTDFRFVVPGRAQAYSPFPDGSYRLDMPFSFVYGSGGMLTTVGDWLRWNDLLTADRVGRPGTARVMATAATLPDGRSTGYGLGLMPTRSTAGLGEEIGHGGSTGSYRTFLGRYPESGVSVAVLCNRGDANAQALARGVVRAVLGAPLPAPPPVARLSAEAVNRWAGLYRDSVSGEVIQLTGRDSVLVLGFGAGGQIWVPEDTAVFRLRTSPDAKVSVRQRGARREARRDTVGAFSWVMVQPASPTPAQLAAYVGSFTSPELGVTHAVALRGDTLRLEVPGEDAQPLVPMDADGFRSLNGGVQLTFTRDRRGQVDGFEVFAGRVLKLRFSRQASDLRRQGAPL